MMMRVGLVGAVVALLFAGCGGSSGEECAPCGPCEECFYGRCVPVSSCDAGTDHAIDVDAADADADSDADSPAEAEADADADADADGDTDPCRAYGTCGSCTAEPACGWCAPTWLCQTGNSSGPYSGTCADWRWISTECGGGADADADAPADRSDVADAESDADADGGRLCGPWPGGECGTGMVCDIRGCMPGTAGTCVPRPMTCGGIWAPVCGCDGATYPNDCERLAGGAALEHTGECATVVPGAPLCSPDAGWVSAATGDLICSVACTGCRAECRDIASPTEGWYAVCDPAREAGCYPYPFFGNLIEWTDCSP